MHRKSRRHQPPQSADSILQHIAEVVHNPVRDRFELWVAGDLVGVLGYTRDEADPQTVVIVHTVLFDEYSGHGLATRLAGAAAAYLADEGVRVRPVCSFARHFFARNPGLVPLAPAA
ncbi:GNAT family N-acetyltransferase [Gordonia sp. VNK21]|uniref:GNAT family N-acetyltransferase n=1 Tax=Gordonia sp. VNK21 TaxID=3382483 RepID=UPI0038D47178